MWPATTKIDEKQIESVSPPPSSPILLTHFQASHPNSPITILRDNLSKQFIKSMRGRHETKPKDIRETPLREQPSRTAKEKLELVSQLTRILQIDKNCNPIDMLFGFTVASANILTADDTAQQLRRYFTSMQQLQTARMITIESIVFVIVDSLQFKRTDQSKTERQRNKRFIGTVNYNLEETMTDQTFISEKWRRQQKMDEENELNELAFQRFLEEERSASRKKAEEEEAKGWECPVCCAEIDRSFFGIFECGHIFHPECINAYLKSKIEANEIDICCPMEGCKHTLDANEILSYIDGQLREKYEKFSFNQFVEKNNASTSWCPTAGCTAVFQFDAALDNYRCPACKKHYCLRCRCDYHVGMTCAEYRISNSFDQNDQAFIKFAQGAKFKQCPRCKYWVERNTGCPTMTCKCGQQFCYDCGGTGCPHGSCSNSGKNLPPVVIPPIKAPPNASRR